MKFLAPLLLASTTTAFHLSMNSHRSPLAHQYKTITSQYNAGAGIRMAPPPGEPEPEVRSIICLVWTFWLCDVFLELTRKLVRNLLREYNNVRRDASSRGVFETQYNIISCA